MPQVTTTKIATAFTFRAPARQTITQEIPVCGYMSNTTPHQLLEPRRVG